ncbi:hypothetical protein [Foetidibacter luteolus]|uniref:hypothetical protein n=1 Tax=Foetidibacter luteolus TaxID=2608880 RepID=UPI00129B4E48|nr:hypothetical protein [Foetidibacter luteolus]
MKQFCVCIALLCMLVTANATVWRVNNTSNYNGTSLFGENLGGTASYPVFQQINQAIGWASVSAGDTLHVEGSSIVYAAANITKKLILIGPGYFLTENPNTSNNVLDAKLATVVFTSTSGGSQLIGFNVVYNSNTGNRIYIQASNILIKRCRIERSITLGDNYSISDIAIIQNFFPLAGDETAIRTNSNTQFVYPDDVYFNNNILQKTLLWAGSILQCNNNVFDGPANKLNIQMLTSSFQNNILKSTNATVNINNNTNLNVAYNVGTSATQFGTANNNLAVPNMTTVFVDAGTTDGKYQLKAASPASNNGSDGTDRGAYGGLAVTSRYTLSGLAPIPVIYGISTSAVATSSGLPVTIQARTIK